MFKFFKKSQPVKTENKPKSNPEAEKLALRLIKSREKYKKLKQNAGAYLEHADQKINQMNIFLLSILSKNGGSVVIQKDMMDVMAEKVNTIAIKLNPLEDTPGDIELKLVDISKELEDAIKKQQEQANEK